MLIKLGLFAFLFIFAPIKTNYISKIYDFKALTNRGEEMDFSQFEGKVLMIVKKRYVPTVKPEKIEKDVQEMLG